MPSKRKKIVSKKKKKTPKSYKFSNNVRKTATTTKYVKLRKGTASCIILPTNQVKKAKSSAKSTCAKSIGDVRVKKFTRTQTNQPILPRSSSYKSQLQTIGLSAKDISYVIGSCEAQKFRYVYLKDLADHAIRHKKIFSIYGKCPPVQKALTERGWVERIPPHCMNLSKIRNGTLKTKVDINAELEKLLLSTLVHKSVPTLIWFTEKQWTSENNFDFDINKVLMNKLRTEAVFTSKQGLCLTLKYSYWFYIENVAEVNNPRTYHGCAKDDLDNFVDDYRMSACTSLLKWTNHMANKNQPIFVETGNISMTVLIFAINRCKEYLFRKQNKDIDTTLKPVSQKQWTVFLKNYYRIVSKNDVFRPDLNEKLQLYLVYANFLLKEIRRYRPQLCCEGYNNIWIIKPTHFSRGRGIRMASKLAVILSLLNKSNQRYVIQKYIEEPLLVHNTKFDIRQYYLITSTSPLEIWMYKDCYLKFSSQQYNLQNYHEAIHLTNYAVQKRYKNCTDRHPELPKNNMWDLKQYKLYLTKLGKMKVWDNIIYPGMKKNIIAIMLSCQDTLPVCKNRFELYGCDFILDKDYNPWIIEVNSCPDLNSTTSVTASICPAVLKDIVKVVIDRAANPKASTGKFECIYRQPLTMPKYAIHNSLQVKGYALPPNYFYRGNIEIKEEKKLEIKQQKIITEMLSRLDDNYEGQDFIEQDETDEVVTDEDTCQHSTKSECELSVTASIINEQIDGILDKVSTEYAKLNGHLKSYLTRLKRNILGVGSQMSLQSLANSIRMNTKHNVSALSVPLPSEDISTPNRNSSFGSVI